MTYIDNCNQYLSTITDAFSKPQLLKGALSSEQIDDLVLKQFQLANRVKWTSTSNNIQPVCNIDDLFDSLDWLDVMFGEIIGDYYKHHTGNYYITTQLHDVHADLLTANETKNFHWTDRVIPYKSVVIPLMITDNADAYTAFFKQRHVGYSVTLDKAGVSEQKDSMYDLVREYPEFISSGETYQGDEYLMPQVPKENLQGLEIEEILEFNVGDIMLFDSCQLHASCVTRNSPNYKWLKSGINIQFYKEV